MGIVIIPRRETNVETLIGKCERLGKLMLDQERCGGLRNISKNIPLLRNMGHLSTASGESVPKSPNTIRGDIYLMILVKGKGKRKSHAGQEASALC